MLKEGKLWYFEYGLIVSKVDQKIQEAEESYSWNVALERQIWI